MNVARNKRMSTASSPQLERAAWQDGGAVLFLLKSPHAHALLSAFQPRTMLTMGLSQSLSRSSLQIQAWPVLQTRPKSRCRAPASGSANGSSRWCEQGPSEAPASPLLPSRLEARLPLRPLSSSLRAGRLSYVRSLRNTSTLLRATVLQTLFSFHEAFVRSLRSLLRHTSSLSTACSFPNS